MMKVYNTFSRFAKRGRWVWALWVWIALLAPIAGQAQFGPAVLEMVDASAHRGDVVAVPLQVSSLVGRPIVAAELSVRFDPTVLTVEGVETAGGLAADWLVEHHVVGGIVRLGLAGVDGVAEDGEILRVLFRVADEVPVGVATALDVLSSILEQPANGEQIPVQLGSGSLRIGAKPVLWSNAGIRVDQGAATALNTAALETRDVDNTAAELVYAIVAAPEQGTLFRGPQPLAQGATFTQAQLDGGQISYQHSGVGTGEDVFSFVVSDGEGSGVSGEFALQIVAPVVGLVLTDSNGTPLEDRRVDLLRVNGSNTGQRLQTDAQGQVSFEVEAAEGYRLRVYDSGATYTTEIVSTGISIVVQTARSTLSLLNSAGQPLEGLRVDLRRENGSNTGVRVNTDAQGQAHFEVLPDYAHQFRVYHNGGSYTTAALVYGEDIVVQTAQSTLTLTNSVDEPIEGQRVDLRRENGSNTGVRVNTDALGQAHFEILPGYEHLFRVYHNGGIYDTDALVYGDDLGVQTARSTLNLVSSNGQAIAEQRVDLRRANGSYASMRLDTDTNGQAHFEILPGYEHLFRVYHNGGSYDTAALVYGADATVQTAQSTLTLLNSGGLPIAEQRVDLRRANGSYAGVRLDTDAQGQAHFEILPDYAHLFRVYYHGGSYDTAALLYGDDATVQSEESILTLNNSSGQPIVGARVDLRRGNNSGTSARLDTDSNGRAHFEVLPDFAHLFRVTHNGFSYDTPVVVAGADAAVETNSTRLILTTQVGSPIEGARVDLRRENSTGTGTRLDTDANGVAAFEVLPDNALRFRVVYNGASYMTDPLASGDTATMQVEVEVQAEGITLLFVDSQGAPIEGARVDLLRENGSNTGVRGETDASGASSFIVVPEAVHRLKVYHNGGTYGTETLSAGNQVQVQTGSSTLTLVTSQGQPIVGGRVDLRRESGSYTGVRLNTDVQGQAHFEVLPDYAHRFTVYHAGASLMTETVVFDEDLVVQTGQSTLTLINSAGLPIAGQRVDLRRYNGSNTGVRTDTDAQGQAHFEVLPEFVHLYRVYHNGGSYDTNVVSFNQDATVQTALSALTLTNSAGQPIEGQRVDLRRENGSNTGVRINTDIQGQAPFEILPGFLHQFRIYYHGGIYDTQNVLYGEDVAVQTQESALTLLVGGQAVEGARVDLLRANNSNTSVRANTNASGVVSFEILPDYAHKFRARVDGQWQVTDEVVGGDDVVLNVAAAKRVVDSGESYLHNFPNPFNPVTTIRYAVEGESSVRLVVYNLAGQQVRVLVNAVQRAGHYRVEWDGRDASGTQVVSGLYLAQLQTQTTVQNVKMLLTR